MAHVPLDALEWLLAGGPRPGWGSIHVVQEPGGLFVHRRQKLIQRTVDQYTGLALRIVADIAAAWGVSRFAGEVEEEAETEWAYWRGFRWMACRVCGGSFAFVAVAHEDKELPVMLILRVEEAGRPGPATS